ncbi:MAG: chaperone modulator CbpM [Alcaligenaceae bacterium]
MTQVTICTAVVVDDHAPVTIYELAQCCEQQVEWVMTLVAHGVLPTLRQTEPPEAWVFASAAVARARQVSLLQRDFEVNLDAAALMADLMQEVRDLRLRLRGL